MFKTCNSVHYEAISNKNESVTLSTNDKFKILTLINCN